MNADNTIQKIDRHRRFWNQKKVERPLIGFDTGGFFPLKHFAAFKKFKGERYLRADQIEPADYLDDYRLMYRESAGVEDDLVRGISPLTALPWMEAMLGCRVQIAEDSLWAEERKADWEELESLELSKDNPWFSRYLEFIAELTSFSGGRIPVSQPILRGVSDLMGALRGHSQILIDGLHEPERTVDLAEACSRALLNVFEKHYEIIEPFYGGYVLEQFSLWAPEPVIRIQEDASAVYSPDMYRELIQSQDRILASAFPLTVFHLHSASLFQLDALLEIEDIDVIQVGKDVGGMGIREMIPHLRKIQQEKRGLLIRGQFAEQELFMISDELSSRGLMLQIVLDEPGDEKEYRGVIHKIWG